MVGGGGRMSEATNSTGIVVSGMRPTGRLHIGHLLGALRNWIRLQNERRCFFFIADWHALTTGFTDVSGLQQSIHDMMIDYLAAGLTCRLFFALRPWTAEKAADEAAGEPIDLLDLGGSDGQ